MCAGGRESGMCVCVWDGVLVGDVSADHMLQCLHMFACIPPHDARACTCIHVYAEASALTRTHIRNGLLQFADKLQQPLDNLPSWAEFAAGGVGGFFQVANANACAHHLLVDGLASCFVPSVGE